MADAAQGAPTGRRLSAPRLIVASHNQGKVREIDDLLRAYGLATVSVADLGLPVPDETSGTFAGNARQKAHAAAQATGEPALSDDSGLEVVALGGEPGVDTALWAGPERDFGVAMEKVEDRLKALGPDVDRSARFVCALCLAWPDGHDETVLGTVSGRLVWPPRGDRGFGFDPVFVPDGHDQTFAEMDPAAKHAMSHRADAFAKLIRTSLGAAP
ncbi:non-canonical purine NTP pyrophosphatase, RdgB/HAM1 family [Rhodothalassium salexigens]|uniref:RdgB/HAM1 family non-canonical purine NTP pyrophosphatase n=1 Tax=Rhodothalassium salexigens TaxID=1086 RepID=UPI0019149577|nr:RdgB/HAM1 family non-canonical purine NTP pyrophosphatase [Rhodothalassium salexigens]MBK5909908.1 non-canonical purine NTP pyrophosphatase, RdgB/HAM1 family [Rhodothalassium salexigens]